MSSTHSAKSDKITGSNICRKTVEIGRYPLLESIQTTIGHICSILSTLYGKFKLLNISTENFPMQFEHNDIEINSIEQLAGRLNRPI